jgi:hypothetical protein
VARLLRETPDQRIVAVTFPDDDQGRAAEQVIQRVMKFLPQLIRERQQETLRYHSSHAASAEARTRIRAKTTTLRGGVFRPRVQRTGAP